MFVRCAMTIAIVTLVCQIGFVRAEEVTWAAREAEGPSPADAPPADPSLLDSTQDPLCAAQGQPCTACNGCFPTAKKPCRTWTIDYRMQGMTGNTMYEFGTPPGNPLGDWAPLSRLDWSLDSMWHGLQVGLEKPNWSVHFEWMTPMGEDIDGHMADYDWVPADTLASLSHSSLRWIDGQKLDLGGEFKLTNCVFGRQVEIWPTAGFRFQRFDMTAYDGLQIISTFPPPFPQPGDPLPGDLISFQQEYYQCYFGAQVRTTMHLPRRPIHLKFQADGGPAWGYNVDHHLGRKGGDRFTMESTSGGVWHLAVTAETPITRRVSLGLEVEHMGIYTTGEHRIEWASQNQFVPPYSNGVKVESDQTSITGFVRARF